MQGNRYEFLELVGRGGFGEVWRARMYGEDKFCREVAVKLLREGADAEASSRLRDEARLLGLFKHRCVVDVLSLTRIRGRSAIVMEYVEGMTLDVGVVKGVVLPYSAALELVYDVADTLHAAWNAPGQDGRPLRVMHRDIKPSNLRLTMDGALKVLDFGEARARFETRETRTRGAVIGTQRYAPPESVLESGASADIFALGVVFQELLTGQRWPAAFSQPHAYQQQLERRLADLPPEAEPARPLLEAMLSHQGTMRPNVKEVLEALEPLRAAAEGPTLREWAVPEVRRYDKELREGLGRGSGVTASVSRTASRTALLLLGLGVGAGLVAAAAVAAWETIGGERSEEAVAVGETFNTSNTSSKSGSRAPAAGEADSERSAEEPSAERVSEALAQPGGGAGVSESPKAPAPEPPSRPPKASGLCDVRLEGDAHEVVLIGEAGRFALPGAVPPGRYRVEAVLARWGHRGSDEVVIAGSRAVVACSSAFGQCGLK